jgi:hypothetical protein
MGFNCDRTIAVVYMGCHCGEECAGGELKALEKKNGTWQVFTESDGRGAHSLC